MSLIGHNLRHKTWGIGVVEREDNNILYVRFCSTKDGEVLKPFMYPDAIVKGHLVGADQEAHLALSNTEHDHKCSRCGKMNVRTNDVDGNRMCSSCISKYATTCYICGDVHLSDDVLYAYESMEVYKRKPICKQCVEEHTFVCERCNGRHLIRNRARSTFLERNLCLSCAEDATRQCHVCGREFDIQTGGSVYENGKIVYLCSSCADQKTFLCSKCGYREPLTALVDSRYIPASEKVCTGCARKCDACGEYIFIDHDKSAFNDYFCPECWESKIIECSVCGEKFYPQNEGDSHCPDCIEMLAYKDRLKNLPYLQDSFREEKYYMLECLDRCKLFTQLYKNCRLSSGTLFSSVESEPFSYLVLRFAGYQTIVTYVPSDIKGTVRFSENVTMTEFRSKKGARSVRLAIERWLSSSDDYIDISAGRMKILNYPVLLRVQTDFDKNYGKQWNGPDDYIEIGNYGDTTDFHIIGVLESKNYECLIVE